MNLAIVSPYPPAVTGIGQYGYYISRGLALSGQFSQITVLAGKEKKEPEVQKSWSSPAGPLKVEYVWKTNHIESGALVQARLRQIKPDLVWYNLGASVFGRSPVANLSSLLSLGLAPAKGFPSVVTLHEMVELADLKALQAPGGELAHLGARLVSDITTRADVVCLTLRRYVDWLRIHRPDRTYVHIPIGNYHPAEMLAGQNKPELLFFSSLAPYKGLEVLLAAFRELLPRHPDLRLTIAGVSHPRFPGYAEKLRHETMGLPGIQWMGQVAEEEVPSLFANARIAVLPYNASTGSSSVLYQAAAWGRAMVVSDLGDISSMVIENDLKVNYFNHGNPDSLTEALHRLLENPDLYKTQAEHNYHVIQRIPVQEVCQRYLRAFNLALEHRHSPERLEVPMQVTQEPV